ncbi:MAG TPA: GNAT family N-acetyltransferase [Acidimicrobiia bacterium]
MQPRSEGVSVREATVGDGDGFAEFFVAAWRGAGPDTPGFTGASEEAVAEIAASESFQERIGGPDRRMFLAWERDRVVGFCATRRLTDDLVELSGNIVFRSRAGLGIGSALIEAAIAAAREDGYREMIVKTETTNDQAAGFYEARGFAIAGVETEDVDDVSIEVWRLSRPI